MRLIFITLLLISLTHFTTNSQITFNNTYGGDEDELGYDFVETESGYLLAGATKSTGDYDFWLIEVDKYGQEIWNNSYDGTYEDVANKLILTSNNEIILCGVQHVVGQGFDSLEIIKTDLNGTLIWQNLYGIPEEDLSGKDICETSTGGFIVLGQTNGLVSRLLKIGQDGQEIWNKVIGHNNNATTAYCLKPLNNGYAIIGSSEVSQDNKDILLTKIDIDGEILWQKTFGSESKKEFGTSMVITNSSDVFICGYEYSGDALLVKCDSNGNEIWYKNYDHIYNAYPLCITITNDNKIMMAGTVGYFRNRGFLYKTNSEGQYIYNRLFVYDGKGSMEQIRQTNDGGFALVGMGGSSVLDVDLAFIKLDQDGLYSTPELDMKPSSICLSPNPTVDCTYLFINDYQPEKYTVSLFSITGQEHRQYNIISENRIKIERGNLSAGIYYASVMKENIPFETLRLVFL